MSQPPEPPSPSPLSIRVLLKKASGLTGASLLGSAVAVPVSFLVARWLGPTDFGRGQFVLLLYGYAALLRTGVFEGGTRAFVYHWSRSEPDRAQLAQNTGFSFEAAASFIPGLALLVTATFVGDPLQRVGFLLGPIAVMASSLSTFFGSLYSARRRFDLVAKISLVRALFNPVATLVGVLVIGPYALFAMSTISDMLTVGLYTTRRPGLGLHPAFDWSTARPLLKAGFPLGAAAIVYWAYRLVGSTSVAVWGSARLFGIYAFAAAPTVLLGRLLAAVHAVLTPVLWNEMATDEKARIWVHEGERVTIGLAFLSAVITNLGQAGFGPLVGIVAPKFAESISLFSVLALNVFLLSVAAFPSVVLDSPTVNRQTRHLSIWIGGLILNAIANVIVLRAGWGVMAVAWNDIWVQCLIVVAIAETAERHLRSGRRRLLLYARVLLIAIFMLLNALILHLAGPDVTSVHDLLTQLVVRVGGVLLAWGLVAVVFRSWIAHRTPPGLCRP